MKFGIRELLFVCVMLGLLGVSYFRIIVKKNDERVALEADTTQMHEKLGRLQEATAGINDLSRKIDDLQKAITFFESKLPQEKEIHTILTDVTQRADKQSLQMKTFKTMKIEKSAACSELPIQMTMAGDFDSFYAFMLELEKLARITRVTQMNLQKITNNDGQMQAQMTLSIFFEPDTTVASVN